MNSLCLSEQFCGIVLCNEEMVNYGGNSISILANEGRYSIFAHSATFWYSGRRSRILSLTLISSKSFVNPSDY